jgi:hypothetical protein
MLLSRLACARVLQQSLDRKVFTSDAVEIRFRARRRKVEVLQPVLIVFVVVVEFRSVLYGGSAKDQHAMAVHSYFELFRQHSHGCLGYLLQICPQRLYVLWQLLPARRLRLVFDPMSAQAQIHLLLHRTRGASS